MPSENGTPRERGPRLVYEEVKSFFSTPLFFILLGCAFLIAAGRLIDATHPSFVFLLAILGVSIVLYGTGTQGVGQASFKNVPVKVAVAGGAGVLAAVLGFGVVREGKGIQQVFSKVVNYGVVDLKTTSLFDLNSLHISATTREGKALPIIVKKDFVWVFVPTTAEATRDWVCVSIFNGDGQSFTSASPCQEVSWNISENNPYGAPVTHFADGILPLVPPEAAPAAQ